MARPMNGPVGNYKYNMPTQKEEKSLRPVVNSLIEAINHFEKVVVFLRTGINKLKDETNNRMLQDGDGYKIIKK